MDKRKYAAYLARQFYSRNIPLKLIEDDFPPSESDNDVKKLLQMLKKTPKLKGIFKVSKDRYYNYVKEVYKLIELLER